MSVRWLAFQEAVVAEGLALRHHISGTPAPF